MLGIIQEGSLALTGANDSFNTTTVGFQIWVGSGSTANNASGIRVGVTTPQLYIDPYDLKGVTIPESNPSRLVAKGTAGDILRFAVFG